MLFKENLTGGEAKYKTDFSFYIDEENFHASFDAEKSSLESYSELYNADLWRGNVVEIFIDVGRPNSYWELEVAPNGTMFLAEVTRINDVSALRMIYENFVSSTVKRGFDSYHVDISIPLDKMLYNPEYGLRINAFRIEMEGDLQYRMALNPTHLQTFHDMNAFLEFKK